MAASSGERTPRKFTNMSLMYFSRLESSAFGTSQPLESGHSWTTPLLSTYVTVCDFEDNTASVLSKNMTWTILLLSWKRIACLFRVHFFTYAACAGSEDCGASGLRGRPDAPPDAPSF